MRSLLFLFILAALHTLPLWDLSNNLAGGYGDPFAHAATPGWYCANIPKGQLTGKQFLAPYGFDLSTTYDSPMPMILTCAFPFLGSQGQFHLFAFLQILFIIFSAWLVSGNLFKENLWRISYTLFVWWSGYYFVRSTQHFTLLSNIWGFQTILWVFLSIKWSNNRNICVRSLALGAVFSGTFFNIPLLFIPLVGLFIYSFFQARPTHSWQTLLKSTLLLAGPGLLLFGSLYWPAFWAVLQKNYQSWDQPRTIYNLDLISPITPWMTHVFYDWFKIKPFLQYESYNPFDLLCLLLTVFSFLRRGFWTHSLRLSLLLIAILSFWLSLGAQVQWMGQTLFENPLFNEVSGILPFSLSRTPGRFAVIPSMILVFLGFQYAYEVTGSSSWNLPTKTRWMPLFLILWVSVTGPLMNQTWWIPTLAYRQLLPLKGLDVIQKMPSDTLVLNLPMAPAQDPSQNFLALIHGKNINAGYLSYTTYTRKALQPFFNDPLLGKISCGSEALKYEKTDFMIDLSQVRNRLLELKARALIFNKLFLRDSSCQELWSWTVLLARQPWVEVLDENNFYLVLKFN